MVTLAELREKHKKSLEAKTGQGNQDGGNAFAKFEENDTPNLIRILPGKEDPLEFFVQVISHKFKDPEGNWKTYQCRKPHNEDCPICDLHFSLWKQHKDLNLGKDSKGKQIPSKYGTLASSLKQKDRFYVRAVIRALQAKGEDPVKFVAMSKDLFNIVMAALTDPDMVEEDDPDNTTILALDKGNDMDVRITKNGDFNNFGTSKVKVKKSKAGTPQEIAKWLDSPLNLKQLVKLEDYEEGKKIAMMLQSTVDTPVKTETSSGSEEISPPFDTDDNDEKFKKGLKA